jgi:hypothetical protein
MDHAISALAIPNEMRGRLNGKRDISLRGSWLLEKTYRDLDQRPSPHILDLRVKGQDPSSSKLVAWREKQFRS